MRFKGKRAVITFHEEERRGFRNVYLDAVTAASPTQTGHPATEHPHPDESAWETALEAAPWIVGRANPRSRCLPKSSTSGCARSRNSSPTTSVTPR